MDVVVRKVDGVQVAVYKGDRRKPRPEGRGRSYEAAIEDLKEKSRKWADDPYRVAEHHRIFYQVMSSLRASGHLVVDVCNHGGPECEISGHFFEPSFHGVDGNWYIHDSRTNEAVLMTDDVTSVAERIVAGLRKSA